MPIKALVVLQTVFCLAAAHAGDSWTLHTIDASSKGADGVRLTDINHDGRLDIVTGWEEGGQIRVCLQPISTDVKERWPSVRVGTVKSPEDAVFADVNGDEALDVVSCCEGKQQAIFFHLNPGNEQLLNASAWKTKMLKVSHNASRWMFCEPLADGKLIFGSKDPKGQIAVFDMQKQELRQLRRCGWIMSLRKMDVDGDGDEDVVYSDRKKESRSVGWLENPGSTAEAKWPDHLIGGDGQEVMFLDISDTDRGLQIACNTRNGHVLILTPTDDVQKPWRMTTIQHPPNAGAGKAVAFAEHAAKCWPVEPRNKGPRRVRNYG